MRIVKHMTMLLIILAAIAVNIWFSIRNERKVKIIMSNQADLDAAIADVATALAALSVRIGNLTPANFDTEIAGLQADVAAMSALLPGPSAPK